MAHSIYEAEPIVSEAQKMRKGYRNRVCESCDHIKTVKVETGICDECSQRKGYKR